MDREGLRRQPGSVYLFPSITGVCGLLLTGGGLPGVRPWPGAGQCLLCALPAEYLRRSRSRMALT